MSSAAPATVPTARERTLALSSLAASSVGACREDWRSALILIDAAEEQDAGSRLDVINYNGAINVCGRASRWREALQLLGRLPAHGLVADAASYSAAIAACAPGGAPLKKAFGLLARMRHTNVKSRHTKTSHRSVHRMSECSADQQGTLLMSLTAVSALATSVVPAAGNFVEATPAQVGPLAAFAVVCTSWKVTRSGSASGPCVCEVAAHGSSL